MLETDGIYFRDEQGRAVLLRGINLSGAAKLPFNPKIPSHDSKLFFESDRSVSFVGRPFPLDDADEHFARLRHWGFNFLRLNITWEAIEHEGPGIYDFEYIEYLIQILLKAKHYNFRVFLDPHQDVWSRFSGGSGAPSWTFKFAGLDIANFRVTGAAIVHNTYAEPSNFPKMIWPTNYYKLACATMFTLFFGGRTFAPKCIIQENGVEMNIQDFLQNHYINSLLMVAKRINLEPGLEDLVVVGYDTLNEPHHGWIGLEDITVFPASQEFRKGATPTALQCMILGVGKACLVESWAIGWAGPGKRGDELIDPLGTSAWLQTSVCEDTTSALRKPGCIWSAHDVWDKETQLASKPDYFSKFPDTGLAVNFSRDFFKPFVKKFTADIRSVHKNAVIFVEPPVNELPPKWEIGDPTYRMAYAPHWYDGLTLINKTFNSWFNLDFLNAKRGKYIHYATSVKFGLGGINKAFKNQLELIKKEGEEYMGNFPCVLGEIGIPFDMDEKAAFFSADYSAQSMAMNANICALEATLLNFTLWNYCPENCHEWGDQWNGEDLSIFCMDERKTYTNSLLNSEFNGKESVDLSAAADCTLIANLEDTSKRGMNFELSLIPPDNDAAPLPTMDDSESSLSVPYPSHYSDEYINAGGRVLDAIVRPYPLCTPGKPLKLHFDMYQTYLFYSFEHPPVVKNKPSAIDMEFASSQKYPTKAPIHDLGQWCEIFLPRQHFPVECDVECVVVHGNSASASLCDGEWIVNTTLQRLWFRCGCYNGLAKSVSTKAKRTSDVYPNIRHTIIVRRKKADSIDINAFAQTLLKTGDGVSHASCSECSIM